MEKLDFTKVCRTCLSEKKDMTYIFEHNVSKMLSSCTNIKICKFDELPDQICSKCLTSVDTSYNFKILSEQSDLILRKMIKKVSKDETFVGVSKENVLRETDQNIDNASIKKETESAEIPESFDDNRDDDSRSVTSLDEKEEDCKKNKSAVGKKTRKKINGCKFCDKIFNDNRSLQKHIKIHSDQAYSCPDCDKVMFNKRSLRKHMIRHTGVTKYNCDSCEKSFYQLCEMVTHVKNNHRVKPVECKVCRQQFVVPLQLEFHMKSHEEKRYVCENCGRECKSKHILRRHEATHKKRELFPCPKCDSWFINVNSYKLHVKSIHEQPRKKEICTVCGKVVAQLKQHMLVKHETERPFKCTKCNSTFAKESFLNAHLKLHAGQYQKRIVCSVCGKSQTNLVVHMRMHNDERPFECSTCRKKFRTKSALNAHHRSHTGDRPHECPICQKKFFTKTNVKAHLVVHTGERHFECNICGQKFGASGTLKNHMRTHKDILGVGVLNNNR